MELKYCCKCKEDKDLNLFSKNSSKKDGHAIICKKCHSNYRKQKYIDNKEKEINQVRIYQQSHERSIRKSGRRFESPCKNKDCCNLSLVSKKDLENNILRFCSKKCVDLNARVSVYLSYLKGVEKRAVKKGYDFNLSEEYLVNLMIAQNNSCAITGIPIFVKHVKDETKIYESASLDRIKNELGYVEGNVQWVALGVNYMKLSHSNEDLIKTISLIIEHSKK